MQLAPRSRAIVAAALLLAACTATEGDDDRSAPAASPAGAASEPVAAGAADPADGPAGPLPPDPGRDADDLVRGCPGMNPDWRPRGSNCFGIFPEQCGADLAARHIGEPMTPALAARMDEIAPDGARIIRPGQPVTDDLRQARLNVILDERDRVANVDCY